MKITSNSHKKYFDIVFGGSSYIRHNFNLEEQSLLKRYGLLMDALGKELIFPETENQSRFDEFCKRHAQAINQSELIWSKLMRLREIEEKRRANEKAREAKRKEESRNRNKDNWSPEKIAEIAKKLGGDTIRGCENRPYDLD